MSSAAEQNQLEVANLLETSSIVIRDVLCSGECRHRSAVECASALHLVFPYRGAFMRHVGSSDTVAEMNRLVFFNEEEEYEISHPVIGADACLSVSLDPGLIRELAPDGQLVSGRLSRFHQASRGIDPHSQLLVALLRHGLRSGAIETLEAEVLVLSLIRRALGERTSTVRATTYGRKKLVDRTKLILMSDPCRRWTLAEIAREVGVSPVYLTQVFTQAEGVPLYRYQTRLRLARALDLLGGCTDLTMLAFDLGFSSHSHFSLAFRRLYGCAPVDFQRSAHLR